MPTSALEVAEIAKKREAEERIKTPKKQERKQYAAKGEGCSWVRLPLLILWTDTFSSRRER